MEIDLSKRAEIPPRREQKGKRRAKQKNRLRGAYDFVAIRGERDKKKRVSLVSVLPKGLVPEKSASQRKPKNCGGYQGIIQFGKNAKRTFSQALYWGRGRTYRIALQLGFALLLVAFFIPYTAGEEVVMGASGATDEEIHFAFAGDVLASDVMYEYGAGITIIPDDRPEYNVRKYTVEPGDTLSTIAAKFELSVDTIRWANNKFNDTIKPGDTLVLPPVDGVLHTVKKGDSLQSIAGKYDMEGGDQTILDWNLQLEEPYTLTAGMVLFLPGAKGTTPKPPVATTTRGTSPYSPAGGGVTAPSSPGQFIWPVAGGKGASGSKYSRGYYSYHRAVDITANGNPTIVATAAGRVTYAGWKSGGCGYGVWIDHGGGYVSHYCHLAKTYVQRGASVGQGSHIGMMGSTGRSTGTHVHFVIEYNGRPINPKTVI